MAGTGVAQTVRATWRRPDADALSRAWAIALMLSADSGRTGAARVRNRARCARVVGLRAVAQDRFPDRRQQGIALDTTLPWAEHRNLLAEPVEVVHSQRRDLASAKTVQGQQQQDGVVADPAGRSSAVLASRRCTSSSRPLRESLTSVETRRVYGGGESGAHQPGLPHSEGSCAGCSPMWPGTSVSTPGWPWRQQSIDVGDREGTQGVPRRLESVEKPAQPLALVAIVTGDRPRSSPSSG